MASILFRFTSDGLEASTGAQELAELVEQELPGWKCAVGGERVAAEREDVRVTGETIAIITLALAIPSALNDTLDLVSRMKLKEKFERLIAWAKTRKASGKRTPEITLLPSQRVVPLEDARLDEVLDTIALHIASRRISQP